MHGDLLIERQDRGSDSFSDKLCGAPMFRRLMRKINFYVDPEAEVLRAGFDPNGTDLLKLTLKDGRVITGQAAFRQGKPR